jgi:hypothetical protein
MKHLSGTSLVFILHVLFCVPTHFAAASIQAIPQDHAVPASVAVWKSTKVEHVYGLPDMKPHKKGTLTLSADALTFSEKSGDTSIQRGSVTAVSAGNQRVELWGMGGRILRMTIPDGGGLAAAAVMHHRVDMLTVEFNDGRGGNRSAVFFLPAHEADRALESFSLTPAAPQTVSGAVCRNGNAPVEPNSVLVSAPDWDRAEVPAAYRALVYEHVVDRLRHTKGVGYVYRDSEGDGLGACPQYIVHISIATFKQGSSVQRAFLGPAGMFVGTTQMKFDVTFSDSSGRLNTSEQITATMRGESESTDVADHVAKSIAKHYAAALKNAVKSSTAKNTVNPAL